MFPHHLHPSGGGGWGRCGESLPEILAVPQGFRDVDSDDGTRRLTEVRVFRQAFTQSPSVGSPSAATHRLKHTWPAGSRTFLKHLGLSKNKTLKRGAWQKGEKKKKKKESLALKRTRYLLYDFSVFFSTPPWNELYIHILYICTYYVLYIAINISTITVDKYSGLFNHQRRQTELQHPLSAWVP